MHNNAGVHKCKLVQDIFETETVVQLSNPPYSPDWSPCDFFLLFSWKIISPVVDMSLKVLWAVSLFSVYRVCQNIYLSAFRIWILRQETEFLSRENTPTGWIEWNIDKYHDDPSRTPVPQLNESPSYIINSLKVIKSCFLAKLIQQLKCLWSPF